VNAVPPDGRVGVRSGCVGEGAVCRTYGQGNAGGFAGERGRLSWQVRCVPI
jgi:hypothetical protein